MLVHICADTQTGLGRIPSRPHSANITHRVQKQRMFESFIMENLLTVTNTFHSQDNGITNTCTCSYQGNHKPQQIDYILSSDNNLRSRVFDSSTTNSDHWGLTATSKFKRAKTQWKKTDRKPIGRECRDRVRYNNNLRDTLKVDGGHLAQPPRSGEKDPFALYVFTDGLIRGSVWKESCSCSGEHYTGRWRGSGRWRSPVHHRLTSKHHRLLISTSFASRTPHEGHLSTRPGWMRREERLSLSLSASRGSRELHVAHLSTFWIVISSCTVNAESSVCSEWTTLPQSLLRSTPEGLESTTEVLRMVPSLHGSVDLRLLVQFQQLGGTRARSNRHLVHPTLTTKPVPQSARFWCRRPVEIGIPVPPDTTNNTHCTHTVRPFHHHITTKRTTGIAAQQTRIRQLVAYQCSAEWLL